VEPNSTHRHLRGQDGRFHRVFDRARRLAEKWGRARWLATCAALYLVSGFYFVLADQQAVVIALGKVRERRVPPGVHWMWPRPFSHVEKLRVLETKRLTVGVEAPDQVLGRAPGEARAQFLTGDQNIINIRLAVQYRIEDPARYLFNTREVSSLLARTVEAALSAVVARRKVDDLLTTDKVVVQQGVQSGSQQLLDRYGCGVSISSISIESMAPPGEVLDAFREVASAREDRERIKREADSYANQWVPRARGEAARLIAEATGYCERRINEAEGDAARFTSLAAEYAKARETTEARLFLEAMEEVLPRLKKIVVEPEVDLDLVQRK
jgi:membrane protease subunit HflK